MTTRRSLASAFGAGAIGSLLGIGAARAQSPQPGTEGSLDRIRRTGVLRIAALPGETPFFKKDLATGEWSGTAIAMARNIAGLLGAKLAYVESTYSNSVLDLQAGKIDLAFALNPTPQRALACNFSHAYYMHPFGYVAKPGFAPRRWGDLNRPEVRVVSLIGSLTDNLVARYAPKATVVSVKTGDDAVLQLQAGRADCIIYGLIQALSVSAKAPGLSQVRVLEGPKVVLPSAMGFQQEPDSRFRNFLDCWADYNSGARQVGTWIYEGLIDMGVKPEAIPEQADL